MRQNSPASSARHSVSIPPLMSWPVYPPQDYPPRDYPPRDYPPRDYPPRDYPARDYLPQDYPDSNRHPRKDYSQSERRHRSWQGHIPPARNSGCANSSSYHQTNTQCGYYNQANAWEISSRQFLTQGRTRVRVRGNGMGERWHRERPTPLPTPATVADITSTRKDHATAESLKKINRKSRFARIDCPEVSSTSEDGPKATSSKEDGPKATTSKEDCPKATSSKEDGPKAISSKEDGPKATSSKEDVPKATSTKEDGPKATSSKEDGPKATSSKEDGPKATSSKEDGPKATPSKDDGPNATSSMGDDPKATSSTEDDPKATSSKEDDSKATSSKEDDSKATSSKEDDSKATSSKEDDSEATSSKKDDSEATSSKKDDSEATSSKKDDSEATSSKKDDSEATSSKKGDSEATSSKKDDSEATSSKKDGPKATSSKKDGPKATSSKKDGPKATSSKEDGRKATSSKEDGPKATSSTENDLRATSSTEEDPKATCSTEEDQRNILKGDILNKRSSTEPFKDYTISGIVQSQEATRRPKTLPTNSCAGLISKVPILKCTDHTGQRSPMNGDLKDYKIPKTNSLAINEGKSKHSEKRKLSPDRSSTNCSSNGAPRYSGGETLRIVVSPEGQKSSLKYSEVSRKKNRSGIKLRRDPFVEVEKDTPNALFVSKGESGGKEQLKSISINEYLGRKGAKAASNREFESPDKPKSRVLSKPKNKSPRTSEAVNLGEVCENIASRPTSCSAEQRVNCSDVSKHVSGLSSKLAPQPSRMQEPDSCCDVSKLNSKPTIPLSLTKEPISQDEISKDLPRFFSNPTIKSSSTEVRCSEISEVLSSVSLRITPISSPAEAQVSCVNISGDSSPLTSVASDSIVSDAVSLLENLPKSFPEFKHLFLTKISKFRSESEIAQYVESLQKIITSGNVSPVSLKELSRKEMRTVTVGKTSTSDLVGHPGVHKGNLSPVDSSRENSEGHFKDFSSESSPTGTTRQEPNIVVPFCVAKKAEECSQTSRAGTSPVTNKNQKKEKTEETGVIEIKKGSVAFQEKALTMKRAPTPPPFQAEKVHIPSKPTNGSSTSPVVSPAIVKGVDQLNVQTDCLAESEKRSTENISADPTSLKIETDFDRLLENERFKAFLLNTISEWAQQLEQTTSRRKSRGSSRRNSSDSAKRDSSGSSRRNLNSSSIRKDSSRRNSGDAIKKDSSRRNSGDSVKKDSSRRNSRDSIEKDSSRRNSRDSIDKDSSRRNSRDSIEKDSSRRNSRDSIEKDSIRRNSRDSIDKDSSRRNSRDSIEKDSSRRNSRDSIDKDSSRRNSRDSIEKYTSRRNSRDSTRKPSGEKRKSKMKKSTKQSPKKCSAKRHSDESKLMRRRPRISSSSDSDFPAQYKKKRLRIHDTPDDEEIPMIAAVTQERTVEGTSADALSDETKSARKQHRRSSSSDSRDNFPAHQKKKRQRVPAHTCTPDSELEIPMIAVLSQEKPKPSFEETSGETLQTPARTTNQVNVVTPESVTPVNCWTTLPWGSYELGSPAVVGSSSSVTAASVAAVESRVQVGECHSTSVSAGTAAIIEISDSEEEVEEMPYLVTQGICPMPGQKPEFVELEELEAYRYPIIPSPAHSSASTSSMRTVRLDLQDQLEAMKEEMPEIIYVSDDEENDTWDVMSELDRLRIREMGDLYSVCHCALKSYTTRIRDAVSFTEAVRVAVEERAREELFKTFLPFCKELEDRKKEFCRIFPEEDLYCCLNKRLAGLQLSPLGSAVGISEMIGLLKQLNKRKTKKNWGRTGALPTQWGEQSLVQEVQALLHLPVEYEVIALSMASARMSAPTSPEVIPVISNVTSMSTVNYVPTNLKHEGTSRNSECAMSPMLFEGEGYPPESAPASDMRESFHMDGIPGPGDVGAGVGAAFAEPVYLTATLKKEGRTCLVCGVQAEIKCIKCMDAYYCSRNCQTIHWSTIHHNYCSPK